MPPLTTATRVSHLLGEAVYPSSLVRDEWLAWVEKTIVDYTGVEYGTNVAYTELIDGKGLPTVFLARTPIMGVTSVKIEGSALAPGSYVWHRGGYVKMKGAASFRTDVIGGPVFAEGVQNVEVAYTAGEGVPENVDAAATEMVGHIVRASKDQRVAVAATRYNEIGGAGDKDAIAEEIAKELRAIMRAWGLRPRSRMFAL